MECNGTRPTNVGQMAKFHTPLADENPNQVYIVLEIIEEDAEADIQAIGTKLSFPPINTVKLDDLVVVDPAESNF